MKKILIGLGSIGAIISAPIIAYCTTTKDKIAENASDQVRYFDLVKRLVFAAENLTLPKQSPRDFISSLKNTHSDQLSTTDGMYTSAKTRLLNKHLINNYNDAYEEDGVTKVVFYYDGFKNDPEDANIKNNKIDFFKKQKHIKNRLVKNVWTLDTRMDHSKIGAVAIFSVDKDENVIGITVGERNSTEKYLFKNVEELLLFQYSNKMISDQEDLSKYTWITKYGMAVKNIMDTPLHYITGRQDLDIKPVADAVNTFGFTHIKNHDNILVWLPTEKIDDPFIVPSQDILGTGIPMLVPHPEEVGEIPSIVENQKEESTNMIEPIIDPSTLLIPKPEPIVGDVSHIPPATQNPEMHAPTIDPSTLLIPKPVPEMHTDQSVRPPMPSHLIVSWR